MLSSFEYRSPSNLEEAQPLGRLLEQCFNSPPGFSEPYFERIGLKHFRLLCQSESLVGGLALIPMGQWFGGQRVSMTGVASVGIAPEYRGTGAALALMQETVQELYASHVALSVLYPATQQLYRKVGYEQGGVFCGWEIPTQKIQLKARSLPIQAIPVTELEVFRSLYHQKSSLNDGNLDRSESFWQEIIAPPQPNQPSLYAYLFGSKSQPEGYVMFWQQNSENNSMIAIRDCVILTPEAGHSLWAFMASHRSQITKVQWRGSLLDPLLLLLPEQTAKLQFVEQWLLRIINVSEALTQRGYPGYLDHSLHLEIKDELLPANNGKFILSVSQGQGDVTSGGNGDLKLDVRGLASLYTGLFTPHQLKLAGKLEGTDSAIAIATQLFAGATPWMPDFF